MNIETSNTTRTLSIAAAVLFTLGAMFAGYRSTGVAPVLIVGGSGVIGMLIWLRTYLTNPVEPRVILPPFLLTVAGLEVHMLEEYLTGFGPAMSRLFDVSWDGAVVHHGDARHRSRKRLFGVELCRGPAGGHLVSLRRETSVRCPEAPSGCASSPAPPARRWRTRSP